MKLIYVVLIAIGFINHLFSQDSIRFVNKTILAVKVHEIGINEVKYNRFDNLNGPIYIVNKTDIEYIRFANGQIDSMPAKKIQAPNPEFVVAQNPISSGGKIEISGNKLYQSGNAVGEARLFRIINNVPNPEKKMLLNKEYKTMKSYKKKQYVFGFVGLGAGIVLPYIGLMGSFVSQNEIPFVVGVVGGLTVGVAGAIISSVNKSKRTKKRIEIANLYNN